MAWELRFDRGDIAETNLVEVDTPEPRDGQVLLRVDRVGMTANNVTYAVFGDAMRYWDFFPTDPVEGSPRGRVPLWGFAEVESSEVAGVEEGTRLFGFLPTSSHLVVEPTKVDERGFRDDSAHRRDLPAPYNGLTTTTGDPSYDRGLEDLQILYRPLFMTSFVLADFLDDNGFFGAEAAVFTSASSKTAYGTAHLVEGVHRVGLTSAANREFTEGLGCYEEVRTYDDIEQLDRIPTVLVDIAGDAALRRRVHQQVVPLHSAVVGASHHDAPADPEASAGLPGARPAFFFAPDQMRKRYDDWGPHGVEERHAQAWARFAPIVSDWVEVIVGEGPEGLRSAWLETLAGSTPPSQGHVIGL